MIVATGDRVRLRAAALWCAMTATASGVVLITAPSLDAGPGFADLLVTGCAGATLVAAGWLWVITTDVVLGLFRADGCGVRRLGPVRLLLLAICGAVVLGATTSAAAADDHRPAAPASLSGLQLPDRATGGPARPPSQAPVVRVRPGDSLWAIAEEQLGRRAPVADIADYWQRIYARNAAVIGPDFDLIRPGQLLELPPID